MNIKLEEDLDIITGVGQHAASRGGIVNVVPNAQRRFDNIHARDSEITKRLCYECGDIIAGGEDKYQDHTLLHEAVYLAYQVFHAERRSGPPLSKPSEVHQPACPVLAATQAQQTSSSSSPATTSASATPTHEKVPSSQSHLELKAMDSSSDVQSGGTVDNSPSKPDIRPQLEDESVMKSIEPSIARIETNDTHNTNTNAKSTE